MGFFLYATVSTVRLLIEFLQIALCINAILSWFPIDEDSTVVRLLDMICAPVLYPARVLIEKSERLSSLPIDISYILTYIGLMVIGVMLPTVHI